MREMRISEVISNINPKYVAEASLQSEKSKSVRRPIMWSKIGVAAACLALVAVLGVSGIFRNNSHTAVLKSGESITFVKANAVSQNIDLSFKIEAREITAAESQSMFGALPVTGHTLFDAESGSILGIEGNIGDIKLIISAPGVMLNDTVIEGEEKKSEVNGVEVKAGYFISGTTEIYYASFTLGGNLFYVEHAGSKGEGETTMNEISTVILSLIENGEVQLAG